MRREVRERASPSPPHPPKKMKPNLRRKLLKGRRREAEWRRGRRRRRMST